VEPEDTRDAQGGERFHAFGPVRTARGAVDAWYRDYSWYGLHQGVRCCAADSLMFHYVEEAEARVLDALLHRTGAFAHADTLSAEELTARWPKDWNLLGGYSAVPVVAQDTEDGVWDLLLRKFRRVGQAG
jgi:hypothetical protein